MKYIASDFAFNLKKTKLIHLSIALFFIYIMLNSPVTYSDLEFETKSMNKSDNSDIISLFNKDHNSNPSYSGLNNENNTGIGQSLNLIHKANRTNPDLSMAFSNGSTYTYSVPLGNDWEVNEISANIDKLTETRSWINGTIDYGPDDNSYSSTEDDTSDIKDWVYSEFDPDSQSSGNYFDSSSGWIDRNALEMRVDGTFRVSTPYNYTDYEEGDYAQWTTTFSAPRGYVKDAKLSFDVNATHTMPSSTFALDIYVDGVLVYSIGTFSLQLAGPNPWNTIFIPMGIWTNTSNIFTSNLQSSSHTLAFRLAHKIFGYGTIGYENFVDNWDRQQVFISNIQFDIKAEMKAEQMNLTMNNQTITSSSYSTGKIIQRGAWSGDYISVNFTAKNNASYKIEFECDLSFYISRILPTTDYETNIASYGTKYSVSNGSDVWWEFYAHFIVPTGFLEENLTIFHPSDWNISWVSNPQTPGTNQIGWCNVTSPGQLIIPVRLITVTPDGFWKFLANSTNYLDSLQSFKNTTDNPVDNEWALNNTFIAGDYLNVTGQIRTNGNFTALGMTKAQLEIRYPNNTIWVTQTQILSVSDSGNVNCSIQLPMSGFDYLIGDYKVYLLWNNSYNNFGINESGIAMIPIRIKHYAIITPESLFISNFLEGTKTNLRVQLTDKYSGVGISSAQVSFLNLTANNQSMVEIAQGYYYAEILAPSINLGNNSLTIYAINPYYVFNPLNITVEVVQKAMLVIEEYPSVTVEWNNSFTLHLNYSRLNDSMGIQNAEIFVNWVDSHSTQELGLGLYTIQCNTNKTSANQMYSIPITIRVYKYQAVNLQLDVKVIGRSTELDVYLNGKLSGETASVDVSISQMINITGIFKDVNTNTVLPIANITIDGLDGLNYQCFRGTQTCFMINSTMLGLGTHYIDIIAEQSNYNTISKNIQMKVSQIRTNFTTVEGKFLFSILIGTEFTLQLIVIDMEHNMNISGCNLTYNWKFGSGYIMETSTPGIYSIVLRDIPEGTHKLYLYAEGGVEYAIIPIEIVINVYTATEEGLPTYYLYIFIGSVVGLIGLLIAYQTTYKYPKEVRIIRNLLKHSKNIDSIKISVKSASELFLEHYMNQIKTLVSPKILLDIRNKLSNTENSKNKIATSSDLKRPDEIKIEGKKEAELEPEVQSVPKVTEDISQSAKNETSETREASVTIREPEEEIKIPKETPSSNISPATTLEPVKIGPKKFQGVPKVAALPTTKAPALVVPQPYTDPKPAVKKIETVAVPSATILSEQKPAEKATITGPNSVIKNLATETLSKLAKFVQRVETCQDVGALILKTKEVLSRVIPIHPIFSDMVLLGNEMKNKKETPLTPEQRTQIAARVADWISKL